MKRLFAILVMLVAVNASGQWQADVRLTNNPEISFTSINNTWCVASSGNIVHVVWFDTRDGNEEIYYKQSTNSGVNWGTDIRLTNNNAYSEYPSIVVSGSIVHVIWHDNRDGNFEIYYKRSTDAGISWGTDTRLTINSASSMYPSVVISGSVVHVVWQDGRDGSNGEIYYKNSTNGGINWGADTRLTNNTAESSFPSVAVSGSVVHVVWRDARDGNTEIYYKRSSNTGENWGTETRLTNNTNYSFYPSVAVSGSVVQVVWDDNRSGDWEIYNKRSTDGGINWGMDTRLTNYTGVSSFPSVAVSGMLIHVVWRDERDSNKEIYYKRSTDAGVNWEADIRLTNSYAESSSPSVALSGSVVHVVWQDYLDWNYDIYYKRNPTGNPTGIQNISTETPSAYSLSQNYPNPFNPRTIVSFSLPVAGDVRLSVFDVTGREVEVLVNERLNAGKYEARFDGSRLTSGVYFYRLMTGDFAETKRMILLK